VILPQILAQIWYLNLSRFLKFTSKSAANFTHFLPLKTRQNKFKKKLDA
jgi:hypothetical protein